MSGNEQKYVQDAFDKNWIAPLGDNVDGFESELAKYNEIKATSVVTSGTSAIHFAYRILDVCPVDIVFSSSLTFVSTAYPIIYQGAIPVFIDSEPDRWNMSPQSLEKVFLEADKKGQLPTAA